MRAIDGETLYERACDLEAQALAYVGKIANDETKIEEWKIWSAILVERTAFKQDIFDAPEVKPEPHWIPCSERMPKQGQEVICQCRASIIKVLKLDADGEWYQDAGHCYMRGFVIAWMPLPEPYREGDC